MPVQQAFLNHLLCDLDTAEAHGGEAEGTPEDVRWHCDCVSGVCEAQGGDS